MVIFGGFSKIAFAYRILSYVFLVITQYITYLELFQLKSFKKNCFLLLDFKSHLHFVCRLDLFLIYLANTERAGKQSAILQQSERGGREKARSIQQRPGPARKHIFRDRFNRRPFWLEMYMKTLLVPQPAEVRRAGKHARRQVLSFSNGAA